MATETKKRLQNIINSAPISYQLIVGNVMVECNEYYEKLIGSPIGTNIRDKYAFDSERQREYDGIIRTARENGFINGVIWNLIYKAGMAHRSYYNIAAAEYDNKPAIVLWSMDIEELEQKKDALAKANSEILNIIDSAPMPIMLCSPRRRKVLFANQAWADLYKFQNKDDLIDYEISGDLVVNPIGDKLVTALESDDISSWEERFKASDGEEFDALVFAKKIIYQQEECLVTIHQDLREEKRREQMLKNAAEKEADANRLKSAFLMNMSHEIRTPMNAIIGMTHIAKDGNYEKLRDCINQIEAASNHLLDIINNVLDLSLIEDGKLALKPQRVSLRESVASLIAMLSQETSKHRMTIETEMSGVVHDIVNIDVSRLNQILMNLFSNAIKFSPDGSKTVLSVYENSITKEKSEFVFKIKDEGIGIEPEKYGRLFSPFEQADDSITRRYGGAGLGLAISKNIIELMGGSISVESAVGKGSTFTFNIIAEITELKSAEGISNGEVNGPDLSAINVLLADDVEINRIIAHELFADSFATIDEAENGQEALDKFASSPEGYYGLVLMDMQMPILDGCSATRAIRSMDRSDAKTVAIVAMTANVMKDDIEMAMASGMNGHIGKPIDFDQALEIIATVLSGEPNK